MNSSRMAANAMRGIFGVLVILAVWCWGTLGQAGPVGYWPLDGDGTAVVGNDGLMVGGPTATADRNGTPGGALAFDGALQQYVSVPGGGGLDALATATVSMWVQWNGTQDNGYGNRHGGVLGRQSNGLFSDNVLCIYNTADPNASNINWETRLNEGMNSGVQPGSGTWRHVAVTIGPGEESFYVDGVLVEERVGSLGFHSDSSIPMTIGAWIGDGASYSTSSVDEVAVWDRMLPIDQIAALANQTATPPSVPDPIPLVGARASTELIAGFNRWAANTVDGVGHGTITPDGFPGNSTGMWLSNGTFHTPNDLDPEIAFDLGGVHSLDSLVLYNYNEFLPGRPDLLQRGLQEAEILVSDDNVTYTSLGTHTFSQAPGDGTNPGQAVSLGGVQARYVKLDNLTSHGGDNSFVGLSEVEFFGTPMERLPVGDVSVTATSGLFEGNFDRRALHLVDAAGLFADTHSVVPDASMWLSDGIGFGGAGDDPSPQLLFDLGVHYGNLESARIWNYNEFLPGRADLLQRGVDEMEILVSSDGVNFDSLGTVNLAQAPGVDDVDFSETFDLSASHVRFVRFDVLSNHNGVTFPAAAGSTDAAFVGLSEVRFWATDPEPGLVNPSFEADGDFANFPGYVVSGTTRNGPITAWLPSSPNANDLRIGVNNATQPFANNGTIPDGDHAAFIQYYVPDGVGPRSLSQMIGGFDTGSQYIVTYRENARSGSGIPSGAMTLGGTILVAEHPVPAVGGASPYRYVGSAVFEPTSATNNLVFSAVGTTGNDGTWLIDDVAIRQVHLLFSDNFNVQGNSYDISPGPNDEPGRQSGPLAPLNYVERVGTRDYETQVDNGQYPDALLIANDAGHSIISVSPAYNFNQAHPEQGAHFVVQYDVDPANPAGGSVTNPTDWAAVVFGNSAQEVYVNQSDGVGFLIRENGGFQIFDGTGGTNVLEAEGDLGDQFGIDESGFYSVRLNYFVPAFDDTSPAQVAISVDDVLIHSFATDAGFANNFIVLEGYGSPNLTTHGFDNFQVYSTFIPEPGTFALAGLGLAAVLIVGRRRKHAGHA